MKSSIIKAAGVASILTLTVGGLTACSSDSTSGSGSAEGDGKVKEVEVWTWAAGYDEAAKAFNASHDDIQIKYTQIEPGNKGGYDKVRNSITAGNAPCLAQVGYETLPSFVAEGNVVDVTEFASADKGLYAPAGWAGVTVGDKVYGAPQDQGPMVLFYNKTVFEANGVAVPTTWDEYQAAGEQLKAAGVKLTGTYEDYDYSGFAWQAGAPWYEIKDGAWSITPDSPENLDVADYWQGLIDADLIGAGIWSDEWSAGLGDGSIATIVGAAWFSGILKDSAAASAGDWAVAELPQWEAGDAKTGNVGGSLSAVLKGCDDPEAAWTVANWLSTDPGSVDALIEGGGVYPASLAGLESDLLTSGDDYFGGQVVADVFKTASGQVNEDWAWGPGVSTLVGTLATGMKQAYAKEGGATVATALTGAREATESELKQQGIAVNE
ncbi:MULTISPECIES: ABC transporter substrate-binding protein [Oerskovia]|uniref:Sugar ABC transporter substrate-binding protein n=1 Tax=Oerskovia merdavium TaxID=2762227 RepID=A0ABR8U2A0_9CELL|nr:sugar ABC transporter substrate-binding protein [Oerskovia merdavium]MBD7982166.1 sugar ABC transporter substrate-binding protein [Oerskovia merdavium]